MDKRRLLLNSIHPIRLLQITYLSVQSNLTVNYFNCDERLYKEICDNQPLFTTVADYMAVMIELLREVKLDPTELALFSALLCFSTHCRGLENVAHGFQANLTLCKVLKSYMFARRNENESNEQLMNMSFRFEKISSLLSRAFYRWSCERQHAGYHFTDFYQTQLLELYQLN
jgi:hypothetical protein